jgi:hypothetical protein
MRMVEVKFYKCDRCGRTIERPSGSLPCHVKIRYFDREGDEYDLCEDCYHKVNDTILKSTREMVEK